MRVRSVVVGFDEETEAVAAAPDAHDAECPHAGPTLAEVALALAAQDGSPLADHPEAVEKAAEWLLARPDADRFDAYDVLVLARRFDPRRFDALGRRVWSEDERELIHRLAEDATPFRPTAE
jgi:hypothetical protein